MNIFQLEAEQEKIFDLIYSRRSPRLILYKISEYFNKVFEHNNQSVYEAYISEFLPQYRKFLGDFKIEGIPPEISEYVITIGWKLLTLYSDNEFNGEIKASLHSLEDKFIHLTKYLSGYKNEIIDSTELSFPVLEDTHFKEQAVGGLEYIEVSIRRKFPTDKNKFVIVPTHLSIDERLEQQIEISWQIAHQTSKRFIKKNPEFHEVIIVFKNRFGYYKGNSLGVVLAIAFLKEILRFYNSRYLVLPQKNISATGSLNSQGRTSSLGERITKDKTEVLFYSFEEKFILPRKDISFAEEKLDELQQKHPERNLDLIGIDSLQDVIDRRNLVDIKKENNAVWTYKKIKKNKISLASVIASFLLVGYFFVMQFDDNPAFLEFTTDKLIVKNEAGNVLWDKSVFGGNTNYMNIPAVKNKFALITDLDNDNKNEVLLTIKSTNQLLYDLFCYDYSGKEIWTFRFDKAIKTTTEEFSPTYQLYIQGIWKNNNEKEILLAGAHVPYYPSSLFKLNSKGN